MKDFFKNLFMGHKWLVLLIAVALVIGILILTINFWRTLLLTLLVAIAAVLGYLLDKGGFDYVREFFLRIFSGSKKQ
ncbi:MAG: DUF2273 domain-containing protein [Clostridia bacterium]|nr:DUF2273 domain-containing protein [Clostridia bacterium]